MIQNKNDKRFYLKEDLKAIHYKYKLFKPTSILAYFFSYQYAYLWHYLLHLRNAEYLHNCKPSFWKLRYFFHSWRMRVQARKLGNIEIPINTLGYGTIFPHIGKIIINKEARVGNYCTLYPGVCIGKKGDGNVPILGDYVFIGLGSKILGKVEVESGSIIAPNAVVLQSPKNQKVVLGGYLQECLKHYE